MAIQTDAITVDSSLSVAGNTVADSSGNGAFAGYLRTGTLTDPTGVGDAGAGLTGAGRWFYDQSDNALKLYESSGGTLQSTLAFDTVLGTTSQEIIGAINEINSAIAGQNELSEILGNGNTTGGSNLLVTSGDVIDSATGVPLVLGSTTATGVTIGNTAGATAILVDAGTGGFSIDGLGTSNLTASNVVAATPVTLTVTVDNTGATSGDATLDINATSTNGTGNIDIDADDLVTVDCTGFSIDGTGGASNVSNAGTLSISTSGGGAVTVASDAVLSLDSGSGSIETDCTSLTADGAFTLAATSAVLSLDGTGLETSATSLTADAALTINSTSAALTLGTVTSGSVLLSPVSNSVDFLGDNGFINGVKSVSTELTGLSGATATASSLIPAGALVLGVSVRVTTTITTATSFDVGDGTDVDRWGATIGVSAATTTTGTDFTDNTVAWQTSAAGDVVLTANGGSFDGTGAVRILVSYMSLTAPTS